MGKVLDWNKERRSLLAKRAYRSWSEKFSEKFGPDTSLSDLSDKTLAFLIQGGDESNRILQDLVMGVKGLGSSAKFNFLENRDRMQIMDAVLYLLDQLRFQAMKRLHWVEDSTHFHMSMVEMVEEFFTRLTVLPQQPPPLSSHHPQFDAYCKTFEADRGPFIRRLIPEAIKLFNEKTG